MKIKVYSPSNPLLKKYIESIYILTHTSEEKPAKYITFPTIFTIVSISEKSKSITKGNKLIIQQCDNNEVETNLVSNFNKPVYVEYEGKINEVTIYFKPLAINSFLEHDLNHYNSSNFSEFSPFEDYRKSMIKILSLQNDTEKIQAVEGYWLSKLIGFEHNFLETILSEMMYEENNALTITELCEKNAISRTTLNKHFGRHICKTPSQFKKILRFRNAVNKYSSNNARNNLTDIAYSVDYFDQSHMTREFKSVTGFSPKVFFEKTTALERKQIRWLFL
ncbi:helix-turn-helix domain-containing protein [Chryseobacterium polytrichastri]|uniref:Helix-turn-helix domain-containing protein n=1 Tax=Chryseobacterium polytrichastri TaxID=1302687 RepID=A0A1M6RJF4_9FLAO|nr:AraC family transcriptional regulator [Chryseobacterium polytrichastri]SHK32631.1 Helix-turn-helix domain-containing protein [Chryseobacterium polytrichastri]